MWLSRAGDFFGLTLGAGLRRLSEAISGAKYRTDSGRLHGMKVRELLSDESKWTQGTFAATKGGHPCQPLSPRAAKWCLVGAIERCYEIEVQARIRIVVIEHIRDSIGDWNDAPTRSFGAVKRLVDELDI